MIVDAGVRKPYDCGKSKVNGRERKRRRECGRKGRKGRRECGRKEKSSSSH